MPAVYTEVTRQAPDGDEESFDVRVVFSARCTAPACQATRIDPAWGAEYDFAITGMSIEVPRGATPWPLTVAERAGVDQWFTGEGSEKVQEAADEAEHDEAGERADYLYEAWRDDQRDERGVYRFADAAE